jgi:hypothetical protein
LSIYLSIERAANYQQNFEIKDDNEAVMRNISRGNSSIIITHIIIIITIIIIIIIIITHMIIIIIIIIIIITNTIIIPHNYIGTDKSFEFDYESIELERSSPAPEASRMSTDADFSRFTLENY